MLKEKLSSAAKFVKDHPYEFAGAAFVAGIVGLEIKYPGTFKVEEDIPTVKIIHVHVNE